MATTYTEIEKQTEILRSLNCEIESTRVDLIRNLDRLVRRLAAEANDLRADPERHIPPGFVATTSISQDIDSAAARLHTLREVRQGARSVFSQGE